MLSTSNGDSRLVWTSSFIHSLAPAQLGVGAGGVVGGGFSAGSGPRVGRKRGTQQNNIALFPFYLKYFKKLKGVLWNLKAIFRTNKEANGVNSAPYSLMHLVPPRPAAQPRSLAFVVLFAQRRSTSL